MRRFGALDAYTTNAASLERLSWEHVSTHIADVMASILFNGLDPSLPDDTPMATWVATDSFRSRMNVWVAIGILIGHAGADLDDIANRMTSRKLTPTHCSPERRSVLINHLRVPGHQRTPASRSRLLH